MTVVGFVEAVTPQQVRGWVYDQDAPGDHLDVVVSIRQHPKFTGTADILRDDLITAGVGQGDHSFIINLDPAINDDECPYISVSAFTKAGAGGPLKVLHPKLNPPPDAVPPEKSSASFLRVQDRSQYPVFVLGAARSGTSAVAQALLKCGVYEGYEEGHTLALFGHLHDTVLRYYEMNAEETLSTRRTMLGGLPDGYFENAIRSLFIRLAKDTFTTRKWIDKTPSKNMVEMAPLFVDIWPNSMFIFMKRRGLENIESRLRKFPQISFEQHCADWVDVMRAWQIMRGRLSASSIEIDQFDMAHAPDKASAAISTFLSLPGSGAIRLRQALSAERPERTSPVFAAALTLETVGWSRDQKDIFVRVCGSVMREYGYGYDERYYA